MYLASALAASALASHASAFLIPLEISRTAEQAKSDLTSLIAGASHTVDLDCPGCPFFGIEDTTQIQTGVDNKIHLEFDVDSDGALTINGQSILPPNQGDASTSFVITAPQIRVEDGQQTRPIQLDFAWERLQPVHEEGNLYVSLLPIQFTILGLQGYPVKVDTVAVTLLKSPEQTTIVKIANIPFKDTPGATTCDTSSKWSICRLRAIITARLQAMMEAARARAHAAKGWVKGQGKGCRGKFGHKGGPGAMRHGHHGNNHGGHHHHAHRFGRLLHQTLRFFVIPALLGVIGGLLASAIGMLVGQFIAFLWIRFHRGGRRGNATRIVEIVIEEDEKDALIVEDEVAPPQYDDLDVEAVVVEDEKK